MIGGPSGDSMTYSNVESQAQAFLTFSLLPWLRLIEQAFSANADLSPASVYVEFLLDGFLRADSATRASVYTAALSPQTGWMESRRGPPAGRPPGRGRGGRARAAAAGRAPAGGGDDERRNTRWLASVPGEVEERTATVEVADKRVRGLIPYGVESRDLGGWTEIIEPAAFRNARLEELRAVVDHRGVPLGRYPGTLDVEDRDDGLHWSLDPPRSRQDVIEAIERGDMRAGSWRMVVGRDEWRGDTRHVHEIAELRDVTIVGAEEPAYGDAATVEYRTHNGGSSAREEADMASQNEQDGAAENRSAENEKESGETTTSTMASTGTATDSITVSPPQATTSLGLRVEDRVQGTPMGLADAFRSRGWPGERATLEWPEYEAQSRITRNVTVDFRTLAVSGSVDDVNRVERESGPYGFDQRYAWPAFPRVAVGSDATSVEYWQQQTRSLASAANVVRAIDAVSAKPETSSGVNVVSASLKQVASVETAIPNVHLLQPAFRTVIEQDLRYALDGGLDKLVFDAIAVSGFQAPGSDNLLVSIRKAITTIRGRAIRRTHWS